MNATFMTKYNLPLFLIITFTSFFSTHQLSFPKPTDTINTSQMFRDKGTSTLISSGGTFELGFFSQENSQNRYVGIWYKKITETTVVWIANRDNPLNDESGVLRVVEPGILALLNGTGTIVWSTNTSKTVKTPVAQLLDSGNLVVKDANDDNPENFLWQSFDYPTDTFLPGMKLGRNFRTGLEVYVTSRKSSGNPASGNFTYHCDPTGYPQNVVKQGEVLLYSTGPWNGVSFSGSRNLRKNPIYKFGVVINKEEAYYHTELLNKSVYVRLTLSDTGVGQRKFWDHKIQGWILFLAFPSDNCDIYNGCGANGICNNENSPNCGCLNKFEPKSSGSLENGDGCTRSTPLNCEKGEGDAFMKYTGIKLPNARHSWYNTTMTLEECEVVCLNNCSCTAYASLDISRGNNGCLLWFGDLIDIRRVTPGQDIYIRLASSELDNSTGSGGRGRKRKILVVTTLLLVIGIVLVITSMILYVQKRKKGEKGQMGFNVESHKDLELPSFELSTITKATDNFAIANKLGQGGFGPVYKGQLEEGQEIAVKCLSRTSHQGVDEFKNEIVCIAKLQHRNLVKLLGWCIKGEELMLVYEYMPNKSLDLILFDQVRSTLLDWSRRFNIITSIARGLTYLHQDSRLRVIHRDLKASNILLDSNMNPKISDFGLARTLGGNENGADTRKVVGTYGYMSPEYATYGHYSVKSDVFSFGVIVLEIVTGKRNKIFSHNDRRLDLLTHAWTLYREGRSSELVDACFINLCNISEVVRSIHIGLLCVQEQPEDRPSMSAVVQMLGNDNVLPEAKHPGFFTATNIVNTENPNILHIASSYNALSITQLEAR